jgi:single-stranded DNA-binding protein
MSLPTITICGNLKRIETKFTTSGKQVTKFQVECAEKNSKGEYINLYISGEVWDKQAEFVNQYFQDGSVAIVTGKLYTNVYEKQDGSKVYENKLLFPSVSFAPKDKAEKPANPEKYASHAQTNHAAYREPQRPMPDARALPSIDIDEEIIPF